MPGELMSQLTEPRIICEITAPSETPAGLADISIDQETGILIIGTSEKTIAFRLGEFQQALNRAHAQGRQA